LEVILEPFSIKNAIQNRYRNRTSKKHEKHEKSIEKTMRKTMKNPDIFHEKDACKICKCVVFPEQEIDFIKIENSKKFVFRRKFDPKSCSKRRCSNHRKIIQK